MKKIIKAIEVYPVYTLRDLPAEGTKETTIEISDALYLRWLDARKEFNEVQHELVKLIDPNDFNKF